MTVRNSWAVTAGGGLISVEDARLAIGSLVAAGASAFKAKSGFRPGPGASPGLVTATGTPDGFVHVAPFQLMLQSGRATAPGVYLCTIDAIADVNILSTPANATNPRDDLVIAQQSDVFYGDGTNTLVIRQVVGTPAGVPSDPAVSGSGDYVTLARVRVPALATTIVTGNITDLRTSGHAKSLTGGLSTAALGGLIPVASQAQRDALAGLYDGLPVWRQDLDALNVYDGSGWRYFGRPVTAVVNTSESMSTGAYIDLATVGPAVTVETGTTARVTISAALFNSTSQFTFMGFAISGATTVAATDVQSLELFGVNLTRSDVSFVVAGLTAGSNTFTAKYRVTGGNGTFQNRIITVEAL